MAITADPETPSQRSVLTGWAGSSGGGLPGVGELVVRDLHQAAAQRHEPFAIVAEQLRRDTVTAAVAVRLIVCIEPAPGGGRAGTLPRRLVSAI